MICAALRIVFCNKILARPASTCVTGTVKDSTSTLVQKAACGLTNVNSGVTQEAITSLRGPTFSLWSGWESTPSKFEAMGFEDFKVNDLVVHLDANVTETFARAKRASHNPTQKRRSTHMFVQSISGSGAVGATDKSTCRRKRGEPQCCYRVAWLLHGFCILSLAVMGLLASNRAFGQLDQGAITGVVQDSSGGAIPNAAVTLKEVDTGLVLTGKTNAEGIYVFSPIRTGNYSISASAPNFETTVQEHIAVHVTDRLNIPITLKPGTVAQTITVSAAPPVMQTQTVEMAEDIDSQFVNDSPLANRNWVYLAQEAAGVVPSYGTRGGQQGDFEVNGQHAEQNVFLLNGIYNNSTDGNDSGDSYSLMPPPDALSEFKLETSNMSAEFGGGHAAVLNATIKSGTNAIHGTAWEYVRNTALDAIVWNDNPLQPIPPFHLNQFGATLGLPILRNRLFYFGDIQDSRYSFSSPSAAFSVPTPLERQGNFTELLNPAFTGSACPQILYQPNSNTGTNSCSNGKPTSAGQTGDLQEYGSTVTTINGYSYPAGLNVFNPSTLDPVAQKILQMYPLPNYGGWNSSNNSNTSSVAGQTYNNEVVNLAEQSDPIQWDQRVDWNFRANDTASVIYDYEHQMNTLTSPLGPILDGYTNDFGHKEAFLSDEFVFTETHAFSPTLINEFRFGYNWSKDSLLQYNYDVNEAAGLGMGGIPFNAGTDNGGLPTVSISGIQAFGTHANDPAGGGQNIWEILDNITRTFGNHSLKAGVQFMPMRWTASSTGATRGSYTYNGTYTGVTGLSNAGSGIADFIAQGDTSSGGLTGTNNMATGAETSFVFFHYQQAYDAAYIQDDWRMTRKLTLNLGLRYEYWQPQREMSGKWGNFEPETAFMGPNGGSGSEQFVMPAVNANTPLPPALATLFNIDNIQAVYSSNPRLINFPKANWAPRVGFAYSVDDKTVVRGGFGVYFGLLEPGGQSQQVVNAPFYINSTLTPPTCSAGSYCASLEAQGATLENGLAPFINYGIGSYISYPSMYAVDSTLHTPYTMDFNFAVQRALTNNMSVTVAYVGNLGRHLLTLFAGPALPSSLTVAGVNANTMQPAPQFTSSAWEHFGGEDEYNSLQATAQKRLTRGLSFLATYTWAHDLDNTVDLLGGDISQYRMPTLLPMRSELTQSNYDLRHRVSVIGDYQLPFGAGQRFLNHPGVLDRIVGGWRSDLTWSAQTGNPFTVSTANFTSAGGAKLIRPIMVANPLNGGGTPPAATSTTSGNTSAVCYTPKTRAHWYNPCAFTNPLGSSSVAAYANGTYTYDHPAIYLPGTSTVLEGELNTPKNSSGLIPEPYINTLAGVIPFLGGRANTVEGPGFWRVNASLFKDFKAWGEQYLEFRADSFNLLNHPTWANPSSTSDNGSSAGEITAPLGLQSNTIDARFFQLSAKYVF
jgi:hypothetical protein